VTMVQGESCEHIRQTDNRNSVTSLHIVTCHGFDIVKFGVVQVPSPKCIFRSRSLGEASPPKLFVFNLSLPGKCCDLASLLSRYMISHRFVIFLPIFCFTLANIHVAFTTLRRRSSVVFTL